MARSRNRGVFTQSQPAGVGARLGQLVLVLVMGVLVGGVLYLGFVDLDPPTRTVEKPIPDDRFATR